MFRPILRMEAPMASTVWRGFITFGLVSVPVRLFRAARAERVSLRRLYRAEAPASSYAQPAEEAEQDEAPLPPRTGRKKFEPVLAAPSSNSRLSAAAAAASAPEPVLAPVRQVSVRGEEDNVVSKNQVVKGYE